MSLQRTNDDFDDELLSAYVDDELTVEERALVEERLRVDPRAAQLVEELRSMSAAIRSLPRETLGRDLRASIQAAAAKAKAAADERHVLPMSGRERWANYRRGLVWSAITIAAALMLTFIQPDEIDRDQGDVAKVDPQAAGRNRQRVIVADEELPPRGEMRAATAPQEAGKPLGAEGPSAGTPAATSDSPADADAETSAATAAPAQRALQEPSGALASRSRVEEEGLADAAVMQRDSFEPAAPAPMSAASEPTADKVKSALETAPIAPPATVELALAASNGVARFEELLYEQNIRLEDESGEAALQARDKLTEAGAYSLNEQVEADRDDASVADLQEGESAEVLVEASPAQIDMLLFRCSSEPETFAEVNAPQSLTRTDAFRRQSESRAAGKDAAATEYSFKKEQSGELSDAGGVLAGLPGSDPPDKYKQQASAEQAQTAAAGGAERPEALSGWARRLPAKRQGGAEVSAMAGKEAKRQLDQVAGQAGAGGGGEPPATRLYGGSLDSRSTEALAKSSLDAPRAGQVRVRFVLRPSPPAAAASTEAKQ
jgi:hypothetical protein